MVSPGVFFPGFIISTKLFLQFIEQLDISGKTLLELGAGSGIISVFAVLKGAIVTASDINPKAVQDIHENAVRNNVEVTVIESDLFEGIPRSTFDFIIIAPPYYPRDPMNYQEMAWYCGRNFDFFERLFQQLPDYYHVSNQILMILSEDCNISRIKEIGAKHRFEFNLILKRRKLGEWNYIYNIGRHNS